MATKKSNVKCGRRTRAQIHADQERKFAETIEALTPKEPPVPPGAHVIRDTVSTHPPQKDSIIAIAIPIVTSKGRAMLELHSATYLDWQQVRDLHSYLTKWIVENKHLKDRAIPMFSDVPKKEMH